MSTISHIYSISPHDGDLANTSTGDSDDGSFSFTQNDERPESDCLHSNNSNAPQEYPQKILLKAPHQVVSFCDDITTTAELVSEDPGSNSSYYTKDPSDDVLSLDSAIQRSKTPCNHSDNIWKFDGLSSFPFFALPSSHLRTNTSDTYEIPFLSKQESAISDSNCSHSSHSLSHDISHDFNSSFAPVNYLEETSVIYLQDNGRNVDRTLSCSPFTARNTTLSLDRSAPKYSETNVPKTERSFQGSTSTTYASTVMNSNSSSSDHTLASSMDFVPTAITFANQCLRRSNERRSSYFSSPSDLSRTNSKEPIPRNFIAASQESSSVAPSTISSYQPSTTVQLVESLLDDVNQSSHSSRVQMIKRKLRSMEIKYYRRKCVWSLRKSMVHFTKMHATSDIVSDCDDSSICSELSVSVSRYSHNGRVVSIAQGVLEIAWEIICFNLVIATVCMYYLHEDSLGKFGEAADIRRLLLGSVAEDIFE